MSTDINPFDVIDQALRRLYGRISGATATDATYFRVAIKALGRIKDDMKALGPSGEMGPDDSGLTDGLATPADFVGPVEPLLGPTGPVGPIGDYVRDAETPVEAPRASDNPFNGMSIPEIQDLVESGAAGAEEALEWERLGPNRKTLIAWLEKELAGPEDDDDEDLDDNDEEDAE